MEAAFTGFFTREKFHLSLGIRPFEFDPRQDIIVESGNDPGVYTRAHELIRPFQQSHYHAVVVLDNAWDGSPGVEKIEETITNNMIQTGWDSDNFVVIVINPELEIWILQDNLNVKEALRLKQDVPLRQWLEQKELWESDSIKAADPKAAIEYILKSSKTPRSSAIYRQITSKVSVRGCVDPAFNLLCSKMQQWFPVEGGQG